MHDAIINGAAQVNIMDFHAMESLNLTPIGPSTHSVIHDGSDTIPEGVIDNIPVDVGQVQILITFHVLRLTDPRLSYSLILGMPWMLAASARLDVNENGRVVLKISQGDETIALTEQRRFSYTPIVIRRENAWKKLGFSRSE